MARRREVRYAWNGDVALAYQVFGAGPVDLVYMQGYTSRAFELGRALAAGEPQFSVSIL